MYKVHLRKVGGSVMLAVPKALQDILSLQAGMTVELSLKNGDLLISKPARPHYTLAELLAQSDYSQPLSEEEREWVSGPARGREIL